MTAFDHLGQAFAKWVDASSDYYTESASFAYRFAHGFRAHIGAPVDYLNHDKKTRIPYAALCKIVVDSSGKERMEPANLLDALTREEDGFFHLAFRSLWSARLTPFPNFRLDTTLDFCPRKTNVN